MACEGACATLEPPVNVGPRVRPILKRSLLEDGGSERDEKRSKTVRFGEDESFCISPREILHDDPPSMFSTCYELASQKVSLLVQNILNTRDAYEIEREYGDSSTDSEACEDATASPEHLEFTK